MKARIAAKIAKAKSVAAIPVNVQDRLYTPEEIAETWKVDVSTVRRTFADVPGVLKLGRMESTNTARRYLRLRIPHAVLERIYAEMAR